MPHLVREGLFIGGIEDASEILQNGSTHITHILTILSSASISFFTEWRSGVVINAKKIKKVYSDGSGSEGKSGDCSDTPIKVFYTLERAGKDLELVRMAVPLRDMEEENLLDSLDVCLKFIDNSRKDGSILVHCFAGVSRSAAVMTAYLMRSEQLSLEDALQSLRQSSKFVQPNDGFMKQLKMFEEMGFRVDHASPIYKAFRMEILGHSYEQGVRIDCSKFGADPGLATGVEDSSKVEETPSGGINKTAAYRCKKCRRLVALQENVLDHIPGNGNKSFPWHKRAGDELFHGSNELECSSIFIEPLRWMKSVEEGAVEGKLSCSHCDARLGYFNWSGIQCSCARWITPAFQLHKCKVDRNTA